ncbi:MAG TPA: glutathione S-transferase family protein [Caulobacteraceae bacterium]|jgi:glutathione S-transferase|nr:glutathione S-transferase family protein [Caulobacteraceae bacterium]
MEILIGDKIWSSWSLRPWLALKRTGQPFTETLIGLRTTETNAKARAAGSPNGQVPVLKDGDATIWDSLAICEYLADRFADARLWPSDVASRAFGRSAAAEMHAGFASLRGECPMDLGLKTEVELSEATHIDIRRIVALFNELRGRFSADGPFLLGAWSIADAFYTPVATRFRSYGVMLTDYGDTGPAGAYCEALLETPEFLEWEADALKARPQP